MEEKEKVPSERGEIATCVEFLGYVKRRLIIDDCFDENYPQEYRERIKSCYEVMFDRIITALKSQVE